MSDIVAMVVDSGGGIAYIESIHGIDASVGRNDTFWSDYTNHITPGLILKNGDTVSECDTMY